MRARRLAAGLTQRELAGLAQVSLGTVRDLEQGRTHRPGLASVAKLAAALGLDMARLRRFAPPTPAHGGLYLQVLGPVVASRGGAPAGLGEPRQRAILGLLALNPGLPVHRDALTDAVWPEAPPHSAAHLVQTYVSRLRRTLDPDRSPRDPRGLLVSSGTSYRLQVTEDQLDLLAFGQLVSDAHTAAAAGQPEAACDAFELALGLWCGEPAGDVDVLRGHPAVLQVSRARTAAVLEYADLAEQAGRADRALGQLADLSAREPLNEKACARLMLTLTATGQQAAALRAYEELRHLLDEQLGVLPGAELVRAHRQVLRQEVPVTGRASPVPNAAAAVHPPTDTWVAAIHAAAGDAGPVGAGVVLDATRVLTCAQVVMTADGTVREPLWVSFPKADRWPRRRVATVTLAYSPPVRDLAVLVLQDPVPVGVQAAPLRCPKPADLAGQAWWAFGFPGRDPVGDSADGLVGAALALGWVRLDTESHYLARPGFSGGGLWSPSYKAVVGVVGQAHRNGDGRAITLHQADLCFPEHRLAALASWSAEAAGEVALKQWGWTLARDPEGVRHWRPRARGVSIESERGYRFRGRTAALDRIVAWLDRPEPDRRVLVVTGSPGVGKSAVLGRVVTTADAAIRASLPPGDEAIRASLGSVSCAVHAKAKTALEVAEEIARAASASLPGDPADLVPALRDALHARPGQRFNLVIDALDEAASPAQAREIIDRVVLPLAETCCDVDAQVVVGTRRRDDGGDLLGRFGGALAVIDLDDPEFFAQEDLAGYALACLQLAGDERPGNPYADSAPARPLAARIATVAGRNFLIAGLIARSRGLHDEHAAGPEHLAVPATVGSALAAYLERLGSVAGLPASQALTALAFAEAPGLTVELWQRAIQAIDGKHVSVGELTRFARSSAANFLVEASSEMAPAAHGASACTVYRLFHQALNDALLQARSEVMPRADDERALTAEFLAHGQAGGWADAPAYLLRSLPGHACAGGRVDDLLCDGAYLLHADLRRLSQVAGHADSAPGRRRAQLVRLTPRAVGAAPGERAALFSVTEVLDDLGTSYRDSGWPAPYRARWASVKPRSERATLLEGHQGAANGVCPVTVAGKQLLASAGGDGTVRIWDPQTGRQQAILDGHQDGIWSVCPVPVAGKQLLASASADGTVRIWDPQTGQPRIVLEDHRGEVNGVCPVTVAGKHLLASASDDGTVRIWDPDTGQPYATLDGHQDLVYTVCPVTVAAEVLLASAGRDGTVRIWDPHTGQPRAVLTGHQDEVNSVCPVTVAGQELLASASDDGTVRIWDPQTGEQRTVLTGHHGGVTGVCPVTIAGKHLLASAGGDRTVRVWDPQTGEQRTVLTGHRGGVNGVCPITIAGEHLLASVNGEGGVRVWDPQTGQRRAWLACDRGWVNGLCLVTIAGQELLASADGEGSVRVWDPRTGRLHATLTGHQDSVNSVCSVNVDGAQLLASASDDGTVRIWDPRTGQPRATLTGHQDWVNSVCPVTVAGQELLASASDDGTVRIWDPRTGQPRATLTGHQAGVYTVRPVTVAGQELLASAGGDGTVRIWDPHTGQQCRTLEGGQGGVYSVRPLTVAGQELLASVGDDGQVRIWDPQTGRLRSTLEGHRGESNALGPFTLAGRNLLASAGDDGTVRVWDPRSGACTLTVPTRYPAVAVAWVAGSLAIGLGSGILVITPDMPALLGQPGMAAPE